MNTKDVAFAQEIDWSSDRDQLPAYAPMLAAYQRAHAAKLQRMIAKLPLRPGDRVLDMACGEGVYTCWLAERVGRQGLVNGVDISPAYLALARARVDETACKDRVAFQTGDISALPFDDDTFDLVWCAQSMYSLPDPASALRELRRVARPGGTVAIFENDTLHQLVLPWPAELELALRVAQVRALNEQAQASAKFFVGRNLRGLFAEAQLGDCTITPYASTRQSPLDADELTYLSWYLKDLGDRARPYLAADARALFDTLLDERSEQSLLHQPDFYAVYIDLVAQGRKDL